MCPLEEERMQPDHELRTHMNPRLTRRLMLARTMQLAGLASIGGLAACGGGSGSSSSAAGSGGSTSAPLSGEIIFMNYPGWIGASEVKNFEAANPGVTVKQVEGLTSGVSAAAAQIAQNKDSYDMSLGGPVLGEQLLAGGLLEEVDFSKIPNIKNVGQHFRDAYPWGPPTDFGKTGIGYRTDMVSEPLTSWADLWSLAPKYSGKIVFVDFDVDVLGAALKYKGFSVNSTDPGELDQAKQALLEIKPHLLAFAPTDITKPMIKGEAVITVDYDYDIAAATEKVPSIQWVAPSEGMPAYLDGWLAIKGTDRLPEVEAFMNFNLDPKIYADFINTTGSAYVMQSAEPYIKPAIVNNPSLKYDDAALQTVEFEKVLGASATKLRSQIWEEIKAA
jgi:spermidine/putrescine transport system substrate-binding protein